jgi:hypothetical protein
MQITKLGRKAIQSKECRAHFMTLAVNHLFRHQTPMPDFEDSLRFIVATYLAAVPHPKGGFRPAQGNPDPAKDEIFDYEEFMAEHAALIEPVVKEAIQGALATHKEMGF